MWIAVVSLFLSSLIQPLSWGFFPLLNHLYFILQGSNLFSLVTGKSNQNVIRVIGVFSLINGFLNPIVYATIYPRYKKGYIFVFQTILRVCGGRKPTLTTADFSKYGLRLQRF